MARDRLIERHRDGFAFGVNPIVTKDDLVGFDFAIHRLRAGERVEEAPPREAAWILLDGEAKVTFGGATREVRRRSLFDDRPTAISLGPGTALSIASTSESEWAVARVPNERAFAPRLFSPEEVSSELRGEGLAQDMSLRDVRLVFDHDIRSESMLVVGEVVNYPGRWSSYPPHHHAQPELYHYRFTEPHGYGHAELDDDVFKIRQNDTIQIAGGETHSQVSAPGYGMYYLWIVRHLADRPYRGFEFTPEHRWLLDPKNQGWRPRRGHD
jgi:5-deoxy-glucuronate isomerase